MISDKEIIRVGAVNYLNSKPLILGLGDEHRQISLTLDVPSRLADDLAAGRLDVALIPSVEVFHDSHYTIVSDACIGCYGPVWSVKLFSRVPPSQIRTLALDEGSRTSAALVQILLHRRFGLRPKLQTLPLGATVPESNADAVLLIGDRAIHPPPGRFAEVWDLGDEWCRWSELPFVFAMWAARPGVEVAELSAALTQARDAGVDQLEEIARREAGAVGLTWRECFNYLSDNLHFYLGPGERRGLQLFYDNAAELGLAPENVEFHFAEHAAMH